jgi:hypothetical protein
MNSSICTMHFMHLSIRILSSHLSFFLIWKITSNIVKSNNVVFFFLQKIIKRQHWFKFLATIPFVLKNTSLDFVHFIFFGRRMLARVYLLTTLLMVTYKIVTNWVEINLKMLTTIATLQNWKVKHCHPDDWF